METLEPTGLGTRLISFVRSAAPAASIFALATAEHIGHFEFAHDASGTLLPLLAGLGFGSAVEVVRSWHFKHIAKVAHKEHAITLAQTADLDRLHNQHLVAAVSATLQDILTIELHATVALDKELISKMAKGADKYFAEVVAAGRAPLMLSDEGVLTAIERAVTDQDQPWGTVELWNDLIGDIAACIPVALMTTTRLQIAKACHEKFIKRFFDTIRSDAASGGASYASIHLRMLGRLIITCKEQQQSTVKIAADVETLIRLTVTLTQVIVSSQSASATTNLRPFMQWLASVDEHFVEMVSYLERICESIDELHARHDYEDDLLREIRKNTEVMRNSLMGVSLAGTHQPLQLGRSQLSSLTHRHNSPLIRANAAIVKGDFAAADNQLELVDADFKYIFDVFTTFGDRFYLAGQFDDAVIWYNRAYHLPNRDNDVRACRNLALSLQRCRKGNLADNTLRAVKLHCKVLESLSPGSIEWARTHNSLGCALSASSACADYDAAIDSFQAALSVFTRAKHLGEWARTMIGLGRALNGKSREVGDTVDQAIDTLSEVLGALDPALYPSERARAYCHLATAFRMRSALYNDDINSAILAYKNGLRAYEDLGNSIEWARTQHNLGKALQTRASMGIGPSTDIEDSIRVLQLALTVFIVDDFPLEWASVQALIGTGWRLKAIGESGNGIDMAISAYKKALLVFTVEHYPGNWARTTANLGMALEERAPQTLESLQLAAQCYRDALSIWTLAGEPKWIAYFQARLKALED